MKYKYFWMVFGLLLAYGLLPVTIPDFTANFESPNTLLVRRQECGCPCAEGVIEKGRLNFSEGLKEKFPDLSERSIEITLTNFPPFEFTDETPEAFNFANGNTFRVTGHTVGVDTILCRPENCELVPRFKVESWAMTSYYPRFYNFPLPIVLIYMISGILALPTLIAFMLLSLKRSKQPGT